MFETLQGHRLAMQHRWQTVPWRGTRRRKCVVTEYDCLCSGITSSLLSADRSRDRPARDAIDMQSLARYAGAQPWRHL